MVVLSNKRSSQLSKFLATTIPNNSEDWFYLIDIITNSFHTLLDSTQTFPNKIWWKFWYISDTKMFSILDYNLNSWKQIRNSQKSLWSTIAVYSFCPKLSCRHCKQSKSYLIFHHLALACIVVYQMLSNLAAVPTMVTKNPLSTL